MDYRRYRFYKLLFVMMLTALTAFFVVAGNYIIPLLAFVVACGLIYVLKARVDERLSDERVDGIAGKAARLTFSISAVVMALTGMVLIAVREEYPAYLLTGYVLSYIVCGMMLIYVVFFMYYHRRGDQM
ncbi:MAG: DUF2178 domain-containing protein [Candidatus Altiarchaeota archaeon]|nr:DUF2178 domain-containing protein [Candidatus Altiarchaeota archaeon]